MEIEAALQQYLLLSEDITRELGDRLYPQQTPQSEQFPRGIYMASDPEQMFALTGPINMYQCQVRYEISATSYARAKRIANLIRARLLGYRGDLPGGVWVSQGIFDGGGDDELEPPMSAEEAGIETVAVMVRVWYGRV